MSDGNGFKGVDNLTPFEYALAGVSVPDAQDSPSLSVIEQMRQLAAEVGDAPIAQARLGEFLQTGGSIGRRNDRRSIRRKRQPSPTIADFDVPDEGGFIDITPAELNDGSGVDPVAPAAASENGESESNGAGIGVPLAGGFAAATAGALFADISPDLEAPVADELVDLTDPMPAPLLETEPPRPPTEPENERPSILEDGQPPLPGQPEMEADEPAEIDAAALDVDAADVDIEAEPEVQPEPVEMNELDLVRAQLRAELNGTEPPEVPVVSDELDAEEPPVEPLETEAPGTEDLATADLDTGDLETADLDIGALDAGDLDSVDEELLILQPLDEPQTIMLEDGSSIALLGDDELALQRQGQLEDDGPEPGLLLEDTALIEQVPEDLSTDATVPEDDAGDLRDDPQDVRSGLLEGDRPAPPSVPVVPQLFAAVDTDDPRELEARFADQALFVGDEFDAADESADSDEPNDGAILVPAGGGGLSGILGQQGGASETGVAQLAAVTATIPGPGRRLGGTFWALVGTAAAAAVLAIGGLWWTNGLGSRTEAESATAATDVADDPAESQTAAGGAAQDGSGGDNSGGAGGSETTEFGAGGTTTTPTSVTTTSDDDSTSTSRADASTTVPGQTTVDGSSTTAATAAASSTSDVDTTTTLGTSTSEDDSTTTADLTTTAPTTEQTTTTRRPTSTARPTTTRDITTTTRPTTSTEPPLAFIGDSVTIGAFDGEGASGVLVELYDDANRDGVPGSLRTSSVTSSSGSYGFNVPGACYVVRFYAPSGFQIQSGMDSQPVCVDPGGASGRIDAILQPLPRPAGPSGCKVEPAGDEFYRGVEVYENGSDWADSYTFYGDTGGVIVRTRNLGVADDIENSRNHEWHAVANGFNHRNVYSVAAERNGVESDRVTCSREN